jgi:hypothetical protein
MNNLSVVANLGSVDYRGALKGVANIRSDVGSLTLDLDIAEKDMSYTIDSAVGEVRLNGQTLGTAVRNTARSNVDKPILTLNIISDLGSVRIRTD